MIICTYTLYQYQYQYININISIYLSIYIYIYIYIHISLSIYTYVYIYIYTYVYIYSKYIYRYTQTMCVYTDDIDFFKLYIYSIYRMHHFLEHLSGRWQVRRVICSSLVQLKVSGSKAWLGVPDGTFEKWSFCGIYPAW